MLHRLHTYRPLRAALALVLVLSAALPMVQYVCGMMGETADAPVLAVAGQEAGTPTPMTVRCEHPGLEDLAEQRTDCFGHSQTVVEACAEAYCMTLEGAEWSALLDQAPRVPAPDRLFAAALALVQEPPIAEAVPLPVAASHDIRLPERVPVRLRTSTYLL